MNVQRAENDPLEGLHRLREGKPDGRLPREIVDLVRPHIVDHLQHRAKVEQRRRMDRHIIQHAHACEARRIRHLLVARRAMHFIALIAQQPGEVNPVLAAYAEYQSALGHRLRLSLCPQEKAAIPVISRPRISAWTSCVPS